MPGLTLAVIALTGALTGIPLLGAVALGLLLMITPWARPLAIRVMVSMVVVLFMAGVAARLTGITWGALATAVLVGCILVGHLIVAFRWRTQTPLTPSVSLPDGLVLLSGVAVVLMLGVPYMGASADDVMLDLARGYDPVNHFTMVANLVADGGLGWTSTGAEVTSTYPLGVHVVIAGAVHFAGAGGTRSIIQHFAWIVVLATAVSATVLGWIAVRVASATGPQEEARARAALAAMGFGAVVVLGGVLAAPFELGHAVFVVAATAGIAASWLALSSTWVALPMACRVGVLLMGGIGLLGAYPPLLVGLGPAGLVVLLHHWHTKERGAKFLVVAGVAVTLAVALLLWGWRGQVSHLFGATGEHSTPVVISVIMVVLTAGMAWIARDHGWGRSAMVGMAPAMGYLAGALVLAVGAAAVGKLAGESYYAAKMGEAAWLAALPVFSSLAAAGVVAATRGIASRRRTPERVLAVLVLGLLLALLPVGRQPISLAGPAILAQRLLEADRARGQVNVTTAAALAGASNGDASAMVEPSGWFYKVSREEAPGTEWQRQAVTASLWMTALRGVRTDDSDALSLCLEGFGDASAIPCVEDWLATGADRRVTIAIGGTPASATFVRWAQSRPDQVRIVRLPEP